MLRVALILLAIALATAAGRLGLEEWRGTEARRVQVALEMVQSGDWLVPTLGHEVTLSKPPLHYWILAVLLGQDNAPWLLRLPSVLAFWLLAVAAFGTLRRCSGETSAWCGAAGILLSPVVLWHVPSAEIDPLFAALTGLSILWLAEGAAMERRAMVLLGGLVAGLALLTKGPPYFMFLAGTALVWARRRRLFGWPWFVLPMLAVPLVWVGPLTLRVGPDQLWQWLTTESVGRVSRYTLGSFLELPLFFARVVLMVMPLGWWTFHEFRGERDRHGTGMREARVGTDEALLRMCAGALVSSTFLLALMPARPGRYLMPAIPLFIIAVSPAVACYTRSDSNSRWLLAVVRAIAVVAATGLLVMPWLPVHVVRPLIDGTPVLLLTAAAAPFAVRTRRHIVLYALALPGIAAMTLMTDMAERHLGPPRGYAGAARILERTIREFGADDLATRGHVPSQLLLHLGRIPPGDEMLRRPPTARWLLVEDPDRVVEFDASVVPGYRDRARLRLREKTLVLKERT